MKTYKWLRGLLKASAFTSVMFVMQACYGSPHSMDMGFEIPISGVVLDKTTGDPMKGIRIDACLFGEDFSRLSCYTDAEGRFSLSQWANTPDSCTLAIQVLSSSGGQTFVDTIVKSDSDLTDLKFKLEQ